MEVENRKIQLISRLKIGQLSDFSSATLNTSSPINPLSCWDLTLSFSIEAQRETFGIRIVVVIAVFEERLEMVKL